MLIIYSILIISLLVASVYDTATHRIPNWLSLCILVSGLSWNAFSPEGLGLKDSSAGLGAGFALMLLGYIFGSMGAGDTKLMAAIGSVVGFDKVLEVVFCGYMVMFVMAIVFITVQGDLGKLLRRYKALLYGLFAGVIAYQKPDSSEAAGRRMPLAPAITLATCYVLYPTFCKLGFSLLGVTLWLPTECADPIRAYFRF
jgi:prepilin peptidase CpaA